MQVKKFEARSMKEALDMVKTQMGPDAIILSAKDNTKSFGLGGQGSVEITAAISEQTLQKRKFVESRLKDEDRNSFVNSPARTQKEIIEKMVSKHLQRSNAQAATSQNQASENNANLVNTSQITKRPLTSQRYVEIDQEPLHHVETSLHAGGPHSGDPGLAQQRIREAAHRAWSEFTSTTDTKKTVGFMGQAFKRRLSGLLSPSPTPSKTITETPSQLLQLKGEIESLKQIVSQFQTVPQNLAKSTFLGSDNGVPIELSYLFEKLLNEGLLFPLALRLIEKIQKVIPPTKFTSKSLVEGWLAKIVLDEAKISDHPTANRIHMFMGPAGSGKTSSLVKLACQLVVSESKRVALISTDTIKIGAAEQLKIYSQILNVPFALIRNPSDWNALMQNMNQFDHILVDLPGLSLKRPEEIDALKKVLPPYGLDTRTHLVLSATETFETLIEYGRRYSLVNFNDIIFTALDEAKKFGNLLNFTDSFKVPIHSFGLGPKIPEDFEFATKERILDLIMKISQQTQRKENAA